MIVIAEQYDAYIQKKRERLERERQREQAATRLVEAAKKVVAALEADSPYYSDAPTLTTVIEVELRAAIAEFEKGAERE